MSKDIGGIALLYLASVHRDAAHVPALAVIVVEGVMPDAAIVPERQRAGAPAEAAGVGLTSRHLEEIVQQRLTLLLGPSRKAQREGRVDVKPLPPRLRMRAHHR